MSNEKAAEDVFPPRTGALPLARICFFHGAAVYYVTECPACLRKVLESREHELAIAQRKIGLLTDERFEPDASGAYINPAELDPIAECFKGASIIYNRTGMSIYEALRRASLEITRERSYIDQLQARVDDMT